MDTKTTLKLFGACAALAAAATIQPFGAGIDSPAFAAPQTVVPVSKDFGKLTRVYFDTAHPGEVKDGLALRGADARLQLTLSAEYDSGTQRDVSRTAAYEVAPAGIVQISTSGLVTPVADGKATITAKFEGAVATVPVSVERFGDTPDIHFRNRIVPIFTKYGCNGGGCHGKSGGQNGFRLSLLGFEPQEDYEYLVKEGRGRRLFPAAPDNSLFLQKAANIVPHGGGERIRKDTYDYNLIRRWIAQGMPAGDPKAPIVERIEVFPQHRVMTRGGEQQLSVVAVYSDGTTEDVTFTAQFEANNKEMADSDVNGLVHVFDQTGDVAVMIRYQSQVAVFRATIPLGAPVDKLPEPNNFIDQQVFKKLKMLGMPPSEVCDDSTFIRRVSLDLTGRLPAPARAEAFLNDKDPQKRGKLIDELLASGEYADYFANKWSSILRNKRRKETFTRGTFGFHQWIRDSLRENKPYDQFVREVLAASGELTDNPPVAWHREVTKPEEALEDTAQLFLGIRLQCAKCHHHPFEKWSQQDYYGFSAFFSTVSRKPGDGPDEQVVFHKRGEATAKNPKTGQNVKPTGLGAGAAVSITVDDDPRAALADWMSSTTNPFFAKSLVNRYWKHFFNRGLVDPEDDMRATNPATNPELLDALAASFIQSKFDLKVLVKTICESKTYQLSAEPNQYNQNDRQNFSRYYPRRLNAEVLLDAIDTVTATTSDFNGLPRGTRAVQIPDRGGVNSYFLTVFGAPEGSSACECERTSDANLAQCLHLINSREVQDKLTSGRAKTLAADKRPHPDRIKEIYNVAFARDPDPEELKIALTAIEKYGEKNVQLAYEDILWAIVNTKEFMFNH